MSLKVFEVLEKHGLALSMLVFIVVALAVVGMVVFSDTTPTPEVECAEWRASSLYVPTTMDGMPTTAIMTISTCQEWREYVGGHRTVLRQEAPEAGPASFRALQDVWRDTLRTGEVSDVRGDGEAVVDSIEGPVEEVYDDPAASGKFGLSEGGS